MIHSLALSLCTVVCLGSALLVTFSSHRQRVGISLWLCGMSAGGMFLSVGAEFIAMIQWTLSTVLGMLYLFYSSLFLPSEKKSSSTWVMSVVILLLVSMGIFLFALKGIDQFQLKKTATGLGTLGRRMISQYGIHIHLLALTVFVVIIGTAQISRFRNLRFRKPDEDGRRA